MASHYADRRRQILDEGKRSWNRNDDGRSDADVFYTEVVVRLRQLRDEGLFETLLEHRASYRGSSKIDRVDIKGAILFDHISSEGNAEQKSNE